MHVKASCKVYERLAAKRTMGNLLRPGGLALTDRALGFCRFLPGARVLDVGCGMGPTVAYLRERYGLYAVGVDPSALLLDGSERGQTAMPLVRAVGEYLPFADAVWEGIVAKCSLSVAQDADRMLGECSRVLKSGGRLLLSDLYARNPGAVSSLRRLGVRSCLTGAFSRAVLEEKLHGFGFQVELWEDHSPALKEFAARWMWVEGSLESFRGLFCSGHGGAETDVRRAVAEAKPGYFLLVARKVDPI